MKSYTLRLTVLFVSIVIGLSLSFSSLNAQYRQSLLPIVTSSNSNLNNGHKAYAVKISKEWLHEMDMWLGTDKVKHFSASLLLVALGKIGSRELLRFDRTASNTSAVGSALLIGFVKEVIDDLSPSNIFSVKDLVADLLGIAFGLFLLLLTGY